MGGHKKPDKDGIISEILYKSVSVNRDFGKIYPSGTFKIAHLNGCPVHLFFFLCEKCSDSNSIHTDLQMTENFQLYYKKATKNEKSYSAVMVKRALTHLKEARLLIPVRKGIAVLNPAHFWKGNSESARIDCLRQMLEIGTLKEEDCF
jgi:hypothetical protein